MFLNNIWLHEFFIVAIFTLVISTESGSEGSWLSLPLSNCWWLDILMLAFQWNISINRWRLFISLYHLFVQTSKIFRGSYMKSEAPFEEGQWIVLVRSLGTWSYQDKFGVHRTVFCWLHENDYLAVTASSADIIAQKIILKMIQFQFLGKGGVDVIVVFNALMTIKMIKVIYWLCDMNDWTF